MLAAAAQADHSAEGAQAIQVSGPSGRWPPSPGMIDRSVRSDEKQPIPAGTLGLEPVQDFGRRASVEVGEVDGRPRAGLPGCRGQPAQPIQEQPSQLAEPTALRRRPRTRRARSSLSRRAGSRGLPE